MLPFSIKMLKNRADVPISHVPANDTPGTKTLVDVRISKPRLKPPDPNAYEVAPILSARPVQEIQ